MVLAGISHLCGSIDTFLLGMAPRACYNNIPSTTEQRLNPDNSADAIAHDAEVGGPAESSASKVQAPMVDATWNPDETLSTEALMVTAGEMSSWPHYFFSTGAWPTCGGSSWLGDSPCIRHYTWIAVITLLGQPSGGLGTTSGSRC